MRVKHEQLEENALIDKQRPTSNDSNILANVLDVAAKGAVSKDPLAALKGGLKAFD